jgi:hypothetical protein
MTSSTNPSVSYERVIPRGGIYTSSNSLGLRVGAVSVSTNGRPSSSSTGAVIGSGRAAASAAFAAMSTLKRKRVNDQEDDMDMYESLQQRGMNSLAQFITTPLWFRNGNTTPHLVRLIRMYTPSSTAAATASTSHSQAASSSSVSPASSSAMMCETLVRASDMCLTILQSKTGVHHFIRDFNIPFEKTLVRLPQSGPDVYCLTRKGVQRFALTKKVRSNPALERWIQDVLLFLMRPGNEKTAVPQQARRASDNSKRDGGGGVRDRNGRFSSDRKKRSDVAEEEEEEAATADAGEDERASARALAASLKALPLPSASQLNTWIASSLSLTKETLRVEEARATQAALIAAALPSHNPGGSSAGSDWVGDAAAGKFQGREIRLGVRHQAVLPDKLTKAQQSVQIVHMQISYVKGTIILSFFARCCRLNFSCFCVYAQSCGCACICG